MHDAFSPLMLQSQDRLISLLHALQLFDNKLDAFNNSPPLNFMNLLFKFIKVFINALHEWDLSDQNRLAHINFRDHIMDHHARFIDLAFQPCGMGPFNSMLQIETTVG